MWFHRSSALAGLLFLALASACVSSGSSRSASATPGPTATRPPVRPSPSVNPTTWSVDVSLNASSGIFLGGDDHVSLVVQNTGRDIGQLGIGMGVYDDWLRHHSLAMGTSSRCEPDPNIKGVDCGPVRSGETVALSLRTEADDPGAFHYGVRFYDRSGGGLQVLTRPDGGDLLVTFDETVTPLKT